MDRIFHRICPEEIAIIPIQDESEVSYLNYTKRIKSMSDEELKKETYELHQTVNIIECFGTKDVTMLKACKRELELRGYTLDEKPILSIEK